MIGGMVPWSTIITGVVGLAGIVGTLLSARWQTAGTKLTIAAEDKRAENTEKRRIYAAAVSALNNGVSELVANAESEELMAAFASIGTAVFEVQLIANEEVAELAMVAWATFHKKNFADLAEQLGRLISAMRDDLGAEDVAVVSPPGTTG